MRFDSGPAKWPKPWSLGFDSASATEPRPAEPRSHFPIAALSQVQGLSASISGRVRSERGRGSRSVSRLMASPTPVRKA